MKIKSVCAFTGLTDRTVRFYIEEGLISPAFQENYLGRRSYDFSNGDVTQLNSIAILRKFGFSVSEIKELISTPDAVGRVLKEIIERKRELLLREQEALNALISLDTENIGSISDIATGLSEFSRNKELPKEDSKINILNLVCRIIKNLLLFAVFISPFVSLFIGLFYDEYIYPVLKSIGFTIIVNIIAFIPSVAILLMTVLKRKKKKRKIVIKIIAIVLLVFIWYPSLLFQIALADRSETYDITNYRRFDPNCMVNRSSFFQNLFPVWPHYFESVDGETVYLDSKYYYRYIRGFDDTYDVYAEWKLDRTDFYEEVDRVTSLFQDYYASNGHLAYVSYTEMQKGDYYCLIIYKNGQKPFEPVTHSYHYYIFAYDEKNLRVRYMDCYSLEDGYETPYYLELEW